MGTSRQKSLLKSAGTGLVKSAGRMGCWAAKEHTDDPCMLGCRIRLCERPNVMHNICFGSGYAVPIPILIKGGRIR